MDSASVSTTQVDKATIDSIENIEVSDEHDKKTC